MPDDDRENRGIEVRTLAPLESRFERQWRFYASTCWPTRAETYLEVMDRHINSPHQAETWQSLRERDEAVSRTERIASAYSDLMMFDRSMIFDEAHIFKTKENLVTRKDYQIVAEALAEHRPDPKHGTVGEKRVWALIVRTLASKLEADSPSFNRDLFYKACGYVGEGL